MRTGRIASLVALLATACTTPRYSNDTAAFLCIGDGVCPTGFDCVSGLCVPHGSELADLPPVLARSAGPIAPESYPDRDRDGVLTCWTSVEDQNAASGGVHGAFIGRDGVVHPPIQFLELDSRGSTFLGNCAPIPNSDGKVLIATWLQPQSSVGAATPTRLRLSVWIPDQPNGFTGSAVPFYEEFAPDPTIVTATHLGAAVVGDQAWIPVVWNNGVDPQAPGHGLSLQVATLAVGRAELEAGRPLRRLLTRNTNAIFADTSSQMAAGPQSGAWLLIGYVFSQVAFLNPAGPLVNSPDLAFAYLRVLATNVVRTATGGTVQEAALLWPDPLETGGGTFLRVAWRVPFVVQPRIGPRLPFYRANTPVPGSFRSGDYLYVIGAPSGAPIFPAAVDGSVSIDASIDAAESGVDVLTAADVPGDAIPPGESELIVYRVRWGATSGESWSPVATVTPRVATTQVTAVSAGVWPGISDPGYRDAGVPDGAAIDAMTADVAIADGAVDDDPDAGRGPVDSIALTWVEFYPADTAGHGARYVMYAKRQQIP